MTTVGMTPTILPDKVKGPNAAGGTENCLPKGFRLADFEIIDVLGEGGFGIVYLAFDHALRRTVAIKEFMPAVLAMRGDEGAVTLRAERHHDTFQGGLKSFINEARLLAQFDHPALVKVHRYWEQNQTAYTAMQYYEGRTLKDIVGTSPELVNEEWCKRMLRQILQALEMLYTMQIVHRDVSPDNIIVQDNGEAVLLDFGSAREIIGDMTRSVTVILKPGYAPIEQYANDTSLEQGPYTDIYALCAVVYFAITGKAPASSIARMVQDPMERLTALAPAGYSAAFLAAIDQGLEVLSENRPRTIAAFRALLGIAAEEAPVARPTAASKRFAPPVLPTAPAPAPVTPRVGAPNPGSTAGVVVVKPKKHDAAKPVPAKPVQPVRPRKRAHWAAAAGALAVAMAIGLGLHLRDKHEEIIKPAEAQAEPRRTVVSAADIAGVEDAAPLVATAAPVPVAEQPPETAVPAPAPAEEVPAAPVIPMLPVTLAVKPWGTVFIDGRERGVSPPLKRLLLPAGTHEVRIVNPAYPTPFTTTITLKKNSATAVEHNFGAAPP
jgi:serine/threonine protein kinase